MQKGIKNIKWNKKRFISLAIIAVVLVSGTIGGITLYKNKTTASTAATAKRTVQVSKGNLEVSLSGSGTITSANTADLQSNVQGKITKSYFKEGDKVKKGDLLYEIDDTDAKLSILKIQNQISQAQLSINSNQKSFSNLTIKAPFDGKVTDITAKAGETVNSNMSLFTITETSKLTLLVPFSTTDITSIKVGQKADVSVQEIYDTVTGIVTKIDNYTYTDTNGAIVKNAEITVINPGRLTDGMTASVQISTSNGVKNSSQTSALSYANKQVVKAATGGTFSNVNIKENQYVKEGDTLIVIDNDDLQVTAQTNDLKVQDLQNQLTAAAKTLENYKVYSPIDGTITSADAVVGDSVKSGDTLISIRDFNQMQFTISVDELDIAKVKVGQKADITIDALEDTSKKPLSGEVIYKALEGTSSNGVATYDVTIKVNETESLLAGMNANANIILSSAQNVLMIPLEAITKMGDRAFVRVLSADGSSNNQTGSGAVPGGNLNPNSKSAGAADTAQGAGSNKSRQRGNSQWSGSGSNGYGNSSRRQMPSANSEYYQGTTMKMIELGINNDSYVEIKSGLSEGDIVVLPPLVTNSTTSTTNNQSGFNLGGLGGGMAGGMPGGNFQQNRTSGSSNTKQQANSNSNSAPPRD